MLKTVTIEKESFWSKCKTIVGKILISLLPICSSTIEETIAETIELIKDSIDAGPLDKVLDNSLEGIQQELIGEISQLDSNVA